jgi:hypothetical protein
MAFLRSTRHVLSALLNMPPVALFYAMMITLVFVAARLLVRRTWLAAVIATVTLGFVFTTQAGTEQVAINVLFALTVSSIYLLVLVYFGVFAQALAFLTSQIIGQAGLTLDLSRLYATTSMWIIVLIAGLAVFGFYASRAGEPLFGKVRGGV